MAEDEMQRRILDALHRLEAEVGTVKAMLTGVIGVQDQIADALAEMGIGVDRMSGEPIDTPDGVDMLFETLRNRPIKEP